MEPTARSFTDAAGRATAPPEARPLDISLAGLRRPTAGRRGAPFIDATLAQWAMRARREEAGRSEPQAPAPDAALREQFAAAAADAERFHAMMARVYGPRYDHDAAEALRQRALAGDFGWLPSVRYVDASVLGAANGAYDAAHGRVLINADLRGSDLAAQTFTEEVGHHVDTLVNRVDALGDEGELFRRLLSGEALSSEQIEAVRAEDDHGALNIDGRAVEVEFWNPFRHARRHVSRVARAVGGAIDDLRSIEQDGRRAAGDFVNHGLRGAASSAAALLRGDVAEAFRSDRETLREGDAQVRRQLTSDAVRLLVSGVNAVDRTSGDLTERRLTNAEIDYLRRIYGDSLDYAALRVQRGGARQTIGLADGTTIGNDIWIPESCFSADGTLNARGLNVLAHEACHAWQYQHEGAGYIADSAHDQILDGRGGPGTGGAYDWLAAAERGERFERMRPEQQAELAEYIDAALLRGNGVLTRAALEDVIADRTGDRIRTLSDQALAIVLEAQASLRAGSA